MSYFKSKTAYKSRIDSVMDEGEENIQGHYLQALLRTMKLLVKAFTV